MIKNICCIGAGYVGGPTMAVIALKCPEIKVSIVDSNQVRIDAWNERDLNNLPVKEPGLSNIIKKVRNKNLFFSTNIDNAIMESEMIFIAVNTPTKTKGKGKGMAADLSNIIKCAKRISKVATNNKIVVEKSTLPVRTAEKLKEILNTNDSKIHFDILSNPEFLAEGTAINDLFKSDRVLIGADNDKSGQIALKKLINIYNKWIPEEKIVKTNIWSSELSKLVSNAMLAQRISSINSISALSEHSGAKITEIAEAVGRDHRIGDKFLNASVGFGGSCFQKDILNLVYICQQYGLQEVAEYWHQVLKINDYQRDRFFKIIKEKFKSIKRKKVSILGWSFKKDTNDSRESSAIFVSARLINAGAYISVYDPLVSEKQIIQDLKLLFESKNYTNPKISKFMTRVSVENTHLDCLKKSDAIAIMTEWDEFQEINWKKVKKNIKGKPKIFDGRNIINPKLLNNLGYLVYQVGNGDNTY
tara:strand:- start:882 stop:2300 length:1419 start_codon:yes stop_codon:yes gene_type:complete